MAKAKTAFKTTTTTNSPVPINGGSSISEVKAVAPAIAKTQAKAPEAPKLELKKNEGARGTTQASLEEAIRRRAYELYRQRGFTAGDQTQDWLIAEREVRQKLAPQQRA